MKLEVAGRRPGGPSSDDIRERRICRWRDAPYAYAEGELLLALGRVEEDEVDERVLEVGVDPGLVAERRVVPARDVDAAQRARHFDLGPIGEVEPLPATSPAAPDRAGNE